MAERDITLRVAIEGEDGRDVVDEVRRKLEGQSLGARTRGGGSGPSPGGPGTGGPGGGGGVSIFGGASIARLAGQLAALVGILKVIEPVLKIIGEIGNTIVTLFGGAARDLTGLAPSQEAEVRSRVRAQLEQFGGSGLGQMDPRVMEEFARMLTDLIRNQVAGEVQGRETAAKVKINLNR